MLFPSYNKATTQRTIFIIDVLRMTRQHYPIHKAFQMPRLVKQWRISLKVLALRSVSNKFLYVKTVNRRLPLHGKID